MLTESQALGLVKETVSRVANASSFGNDATLESLGIRTADDLRRFQITICSDPDVGVPKLQHYLDPNAIVNVTKTFTVDAVAKHIALLAAGKLCSNTTTPHPQRYPYPSKCGVCGAPVK